MAAAAGAVAVAACDDAIPCPGPVQVVIQTPSSTVLADADPAAAGVQTDVRVRTTLAAGGRIELDVVTATGDVIETRTAVADEAGAATLAGVTLPVPKAVLRARAAGGACGTAEDAVTVDVAAGGACAIAVSPAPRASAFYAPLGVLIAADDPLPGAAGLQAAISVATRAGAEVELFETAGGVERSIGRRVADARGVVETPRTFADGAIGLRAACREAGEGGAEAAATLAFVVDTAAPRCALAAPVPGGTITPADDENGDLTDGVQLAIAVRAGGAGGAGDADNPYNDTIGEPVTISLAPAGGAPQPVAATPVDAAGLATATAVLAPAATPAAYELSIEVRDHAGNACALTAAYDVVYDGCEIDVAAPLAPVTADADGNPGNGSQLDVQLAIDPACAGRAVTSSCGANDPAGVVPASGALALRVDACASSPCEAELPCVFAVTTAAGATTRAAAPIAFDDQGPAATVEVLQPALACGAVITPASDADPAAAGVQVVARVVAPGAATRALELTSALGTVSAEAPGPVAVTLAPGPNQLVGVGTDALGNRGESAACELTLVDLVVAFAGPPADGLVGRPDGAAAGGALTLPVCGTVDRPGATVAVAVDGGAPVPAQVTGTAWCAQLTLGESPPLHRVVATASAGGAFGLAALPLRVDLTPPPPPAALVAAGRDRRSVALAWTAPADGAQPVARYLVRRAAAPIDDASFDAAIAVDAPPPQAPGGAEALAIDRLRAGAPIYVAVASVDAAGNRSAPAAAGPVVLGLDQTGAIGSPEAGLGSLALGTAIVHGRFDDDDHDDLAVAAPQQDAPGAPQAGAVYVYFGGPGGLPATPDLILRGPGPNARFGAALAALRRSSAARDDLAIGAPLADGGRGRIYVFDGGPGLGAGTLPAAAADLVISVRAAAPGALAGGNLGARLAVTDFDGDGLDDLIAAAPQAAGGAGAVAVLYGGTITGDVELSDVDPSGVAAVAELVVDPAAPAGRGFGFYLHAVGPTQGAADASGDLVVGAYDDAATAGDPAWIVRGDAERPAAPGLALRPLAAGRDVRIDLVTPYRISEWGSQAASVDDLDGDGARDLAIGAYRNISATGQVLIVSGAVAGAAGAARTTDPGVVIAAITGAPGSRFGALIAAHDPRTAPDLDGDGLDELVAAGVSGGDARLYVWYGGALPTGAATPASAAYAITGPAQFRLTPQRPQGPAGVARWIGDLDGDGLDDLCWASPFDNTNGGDGGFEVLWDEP